jgi:hypothetical protein
MENLIRVLPIDALLTPELDPVSLGRAMTFGTTGDGAGDPSHNWTAPSSSTRWAIR